jgi:putative flippase GtrA
MSRVARFATVGAFGFILQLGALALSTAAGYPYLLAAAIAVELAALHNFYWHERWTWSDRVLPQRTVGRPLIDYHLTTVLIAVAGNVTLTGAIVEIFGAPPVLANVAAVAVLAAASFALADRYVFVLPRKDCATRERLDDNARRLQSLAELATQRAGAWRIAVNADRVDLHRHWCAVDRHHDAVRNHPDGAGDDGSRIGEHGTGRRPPRERAIGLVRSIREGLSSNAKSAGHPRFEQLRIGRRQQHQRRIERRHGANDARRQIAISSCHVVERAVRLHVLERDTLRTRHACDSRDLVEDEIFRFRSGEAHLTPPEAAQVGQSGMRTDSYAVFSREANGLPQDCGIAAVETGRDAG